MWSLEVKRFCPLAYFKATHCHCRVHNPRAKKKLLPCSESESYNSSDQKLKMRKRKRERGREREMRSPWRSFSLKEMNSALPAPRMRQRPRSVQIALSIIIAEAIQADPRSPNNKYVRDRTAKSPRGNKGGHFGSQCQCGNTNKRLRISETQKESASLGSNQVVMQQREGAAVWKWLKFTSEIENCLQFSLYIFFVNSWQRSSFRKRKKKKISPIFRPLTGCCYYGMLLLVKLHQEGDFFSLQSNRWKKETSQNKSKSVARAPRTFLGSYEAASHCSFDFSPLTNRHSVANNKPPSQLKLQRKVSRCVQPHVGLCSCS